MITTSVTKTDAAALTGIIISESHVSRAFASDRGIAVKQVKQHSRKATLPGAPLGIGSALLGAAIVHPQARTAEARHRRFHGR